MGWIGARTGLTTVVMARYTLGTRGAKLSSVLLGGTQIGWYAVVVGTIGDLTAEALGWESYGARAAVMVVTSALMCATAYWGYGGMYWVSLVSTPLILILAFWVLARSLQEVGGFAGLADVRADDLDGAGGGHHHRGRHLRVGRHAGAELDPVRPQRRRTRCWPASSGS